MAGKRGFAPTQDASPPHGGKTGPEGATRLVKAGVSDDVLQAFIADAEQASRLGVRFAFGTRADVALALGRELREHRAAAEQEASDEGKARAHSEPVHNPTATLPTVTFSKYESDKRDDARHGGQT